MATKVKAQDVAVLNASPSDASSKRTHVNANISFQTINTSGDELHAVTAGTTFYLTDLILTVINSNTADSICSIKDDTTVLIPFLSGGSTTEGNGQLIIIHTFKEPIPFSTSVDIFSGNASGVVASCVIAGYEEESDLKS